VSGLPDTVLAAVLMAVLMTLDGLSVALSTDEMLSPVTAVRGLHGVNARHVCSRLCPTPHVKWNSRFIVLASVCVRIKTIQQTVHDPKKKQAICACDPRELQRIYLGLCVPRNSIRSICAALQPVHATKRPI